MTSYSDEPRYETSTASPQHSAGMSGDGGGMSPRVSDVAHGAADSGADVAREAAGHVKEVAGEAKRQARDLVGEARNQVSSQASSQQQNAAKQLRNLSDQFRSMAENGQQSELANELAHQASDRTSSVANWLERREPGDLLNEVRDFARRRPGTFLLGALVAGVVAGRLTRSLASNSSGSSGRSLSLTPYQGTTTYQGGGYEGTADPGGYQGTTPYEGGGYQGGGYQGTPYEGGGYSGTTPYQGTGYQPTAYASTEAVVEGSSTSVPPDPYLTNLTANEDIQEPPAEDIEGRVRP